MWLCRLLQHQAPVLSRGFAKAAKAPAKGAAKTATAPVEAAARSEPALKPEEYPDWVSDLVTPGKTLGELKRMQETARSMQEDQRMIKLSQRASIKATNFSKAKGDSCTSSMVMKEFRTGAALLMVILGMSYVKSYTKIEKANTTLSGLMF